VFPSKEHRLRSERALVFQTNVPLATMESDPELKRLYENPSTISWWGDRRNIIAGPIWPRSCYDLHLTATIDFQLPQELEQIRAGDISTRKTWTGPLAPELVSKVREAFADFDPVIGKMLQGVDNLWHWLISETPPLPTWSSENKKVVLVGDAAHSLAPWIGQVNLVALPRSHSPLNSLQGVNMNLEDVAVLDVLLASNGLDAASLASRVKLYESLRIERVEKIRRMVLLWASLANLPPGPEQEARDAMLKSPETMKAIQQAVPDGDAPLQDPRFRKWIVAHDAIKDV
jgi:salicylate hydroxylase